MNASILTKWMLVPTIAVVAMNAGDSSLAVFMVWFRYLLSSNYLLATRCCVMGDGFLGIYRSGNLIFASQGFYVNVLPSSVMVASNESFPPYFLSAT